MSLGVAGRDQEGSTEETGSKGVPGEKSCC